VPSLDDLVKNDLDQASIGLLPCRSRKTVIVEYALPDSAKPMVVAEYRMQLPSRMAEDFRNVDQIAIAMKF
jgi:hypothetical protein